MTQFRVQHAFSRRRFYAQNQAAMLVILGTAILLVLGSIYLSKVASFAITNRAIEELIIQRDKLKYENEQIIAEIARFRTVPRLNMRALDIGFRLATNNEIDYVVIEGYSPSRRNSFTETASTRAQPAPSPVYDETFGGWIQQQLASLQAQIEAFGN